MFAAQQKRRIVVLARNVRGDLRALRLQSPVKWPKVLNGNNLRVNAVAPGLTETPLTQSLTANESARKLSEAMHALGRLGQPEDIARAIVFLLDPANSWITGQVLAVDGGLSRVRPRMKA